MASLRRILLAVAYSGTGAKQSAFGTPLSNGALDTLFNLTEGRSHIEPVRNIKEIPDCLGRNIIGLQELTRYARLRLEFNLDIKSAPVMAAYAMGVAASPTGPVSGNYTHAITRLAERLFVLPFFTVIAIFADSAASDPGIKMQDCVVNNFTITAASQGDEVLCQVEIIGKGDLAAAVGYTPPDCSSYTPLRLVDGALTLDSENLLSGTDANHTALSAEFTMSNSLPTGDFLFPLASQDIKRIEQGNVLTQALNLGVGGRLNDTLHTKAKNLTVAASAWRIGSATSGITITVPSGVIREGSPAQDWFGEVSEAGLRIVHQPLIVPGNAATPMNMTVVNTQATAYLL